MGRRKLGTRVVGPYRRRDDGTWLCYYARADGEREYLRFPDEAAAQAWATAARASLGVVAATVGEAIDRYREHLIAKGNRRKSYDETIRRLRAFVGVDVAIGFHLLTATWGRRAYKRFRETALAPRAKGADASPPRYPSVDYHRNALAEAKTFFRWCVSEHLFARNPLEGVEGVGRRRHGKKRLRLDETRRWERVALEIARDGERWEREGARAALCALYLGLRASEIVSREARDLDDEGRVLWVDDVDEGFLVKTTAGKRTLRIPEVLRPLLIDQARGREAHERLFAHDRDWVRDWVRRICERAKVPVITTHGLRGTHSAIGIEAGITPHAIAAAMGHESFATTTESYAGRETVAEATRARGLRVLDGGISATKPLRARGPRKKP